MNTPVRTLLLLLLLAACCATGFCAEKAGMEYTLLATTKTSTMQKEMNEAAAQGFHFGGVMGGETAFGGKEVVVIMVRKPGENSGRLPLQAAGHKSHLHHAERDSAGGQRGF